MLAQNIISYLHDFYHQNTPLANASWGQNPRWRWTRTFPSLGNQLLGSWSRSSRCGRPKKRYRCWTAISCIVFSQRGSQSPPLYSLEFHCILGKKRLTFTAGSQQTILPSFKRGMVAVLAVNFYENQLTTNERSNIEHARTSKSSWLNHVRASFWLVHWCVAMIS